MEDYISVLEKEIQKLVDEHDGLPAELEVLETHLVPLGQGEKPTKIDMSPEKIERRNFLRKRIPEIVRELNEKRDLRARLINEKNLHNE